MVPLAGTTLAEQLDLGDLGLVAALDDHDDLRVAAGPGSRRRDDADQCDVVRRHDQVVGRRSYPAVRRRDVEPDRVDAVSLVSVGRLRLDGRLAVAEVPRVSGDAVACGVVGEIEESNGLTRGRFRGLDHEARDGARTDRRSAVVSPHRPDPRATCQARSNTWLIRVLCEREIRAYGGLRS